MHRIQLAAVSSYSGDMYLFVQSINSTSGRLNNNKLFFIQTNNLSFSNSYLYVLWLCCFRGFLFYLKVLPSCVVITYLVIFISSHCLISCPFSVSTCVLFVISIALYYSSIEIVYSLCAPSCLCQFFLFCPPMSITFVLLVFCTLL